MIRFFQVTGSKVKVTETFSGGGIPIHGSPSTSIWFCETIPSLSAASLDS